MNQKLVVRINVEKIQSIAIRSITKKDKLIRNIIIENDNQLEGGQKILRKLTWKNQQEKEELASA